MVEDIIENGNLAVDISHLDDDTDWSEMEKITLPDSFDMIVVEDDETTARFIKAVTQRTQSDARIKLFRSAEKAIEHLELIRKGGFPPPEVALVDIKLLGKLDGFAVSEYLSKHFPNTSVAIISSITVDEYMKKTKRQVQPPIFLPKPLTIRQIQSLFEYPH